MAGSLIKIDEEIVTSAVSSVTLGVADWDSSYDVYMLTGANIECSTSTAYVKLRFTESGTPNTSANYDGAFKLIRAYNTFLNRANLNDTSIEVTRLAQGSGANTSNFIVYIFNANNASEYTFITNEAVALTGSAATEGSAGGSVFTSASAVDGVNLFFNTGNIAGGTFTLYGLAK
jgi:hypothetical protein